MASSDDEGESRQTLSYVSDYYFIDENDEPISVAELPIKWDEKETLDGNVREIFLKGVADNGLQKIHKQVKAWSFDLSLPKPEISVLTMKNECYKLLKPRKSFTVTIRSVLVSVHCLHLLKKRPNLSGKALWDNLSKIFSTYEPRPSENDLVDQISMISEAVNRDEDLEKSQVLVTFLKKKPRKKKFHEEDGNMSKFIVDDDVTDGNDLNDEDGDEGESEDEDEDGFDSVCAICDNGGDLLCCDGRCLRSFHATREAGSESNCKSLRLSNEEVRRLQNFLCKNCEYNQHQCYACGKLGSSDKLSGAEVFRCVVATCGHFYHPDCAAKFLCPQNEMKRGELRDKISVGGQFTCPVHACYVCKQGENKDEEALQFAVCRRCPKSYHRKCLPREIAFDEDEDDVLQRAWEGLLPYNRILIYCLDHEIDEDLLTPARNHIKFPGMDIEEKKTTVSSLSSGIQKTSVDASRNRDMVKKSKGDENSSSAMKQVDSSKVIERRMSSGISSKVGENRIPAQHSLRKQKALATSKRTLSKSASAKMNNSSTSDGRPSLGESLFALVQKDVETDEDAIVDEEEQSQIAVSDSEETDALDTDALNKVLSMMEEVESSVTLESIEKTCKPIASSYAYKAMDKSITLGKVEAYIESIRAALQKLEEGGCAEDAKSVCEPRFLNQIMKWRDKLKVYLSPFLFGMRYTSFGRHFTKVDKLQAIVDRLRWYVQDGDMIVDFCCGSNDFSCIMKEKLDEMGKSCFYKNYDIYPPKNDFCFEKRDWLTVMPTELPPGSKLIMGLNPPFGMNARLANQFIDKALKFKPKLVILIVPRETERLDSRHKNPRYELVWEDDELLAGKSFYLPGSIDVNNKQMEDWNVATTPLYLWSRADWTSKHKSVAEQQGHMTRMHEMIEPNQNPDGVSVPVRLAESSMPVDNCSLKKIDENSIAGSKSLNGEFCSSQKAERVLENTQLNEKLRATNQDMGKRGRGPEETIPEDEKSASINHGMEKEGRGSEEIIPVDKKSIVTVSNQGKGKQGRVSEETISEERKSLVTNQGKVKRGRGSVETLPEEPSGKRPAIHHPSPGIIGGRLKPSETATRAELHKEVLHSELRCESKPQWQSRSGGNQDGDTRRYLRKSEEHSSSYGGKDNGDTRRYRMNMEGPAMDVNRWSNTSTPTPGYGFRPVPDEQFITHRRDVADFPGYSFAGGGDQYRRESYYPREQVQQFGRLDPAADYANQRNTFPGFNGPPYSSSYAHVPPSANPPHNYRSAMQRYAPRLDELNHVRMNPTVPQPHLAAGGGGGGGMYELQVRRPPFRGNTLGFAPGPYRPYPNNGSSGWLNE